MIKTPNFRGVPMYERIKWSDVNIIPKAKAQYIIVYDDIYSETGGIIEVMPTDEWIALAMNGGILPPIETWHKMKFKLMNDKDEIFICDFLELEEIRRTNKIVQENLLNDDEVRESQPLGPLSEEETMEYLLMKDVPPRIWHDKYKRNRCLFKICRPAQLPEDFTFRKAWRLI